MRDAAVDVVREYGGLVNQAIGEEIVSVFGVPAAHDDDDLRAVRAAMALQARVAALDETGGRSAAGLRVQSGLHVGAVVARRLHEGPRRFDIVGAAPSMAARLAGLAEPSTVLISPETQRLVAPYMQTTARSPVVLDPKAAPVTPFRVIGETGIATRLEASTRSGLTPYVGRQAELSMLEAAVRRAANGAGQVIAILGEAGAGKSRLLYELQERVGGTRAVRLIEAGCRAYGDAVPYGVFVQVLCDALDLRGPLPNAAAVVGRLRAADPTLEPFLPLFLHLLSVKSDAHPLPRHLHGEHLQAAMLDALAALVGVLTARGPVVLLIEDWQWADTGSRAALARVAEVAAASPLVLVVTSRLEPGVRADWPAGSLQVQLEQLDFDASAVILQSALGVARVAESLARRLYDRAGGNPFFLEQMCAALREQHAIVVRNGEALIDADDAVLSLPETVQGVIRARLDNLSPHALETLRVASVIGAAFDHALLAEVVPTSVDLGPALTALADASLIHQTTVAPTIGYRFTHALTQEVCYDSLVGHQRKALHGAIGRALMTSGKRMDDGAAALAHHFGRAEDWPSAIHFGRRAADRAVALSQFAEALATLDDVLAWVGHLPDQIPGTVTADVLLQQERLCETLGLRARQREIIDALIAHLARDGSSSRLAEVYLRQGDLSTLLKRFDAADRALGTALRIGHERGDAALLRSGLRSLGLLRWHEGRHAEALDITRRALAVDRESDDQLSVAVDLTNLGNILRATGDYAEARARLEEALAMPVLREDPRKLVYTQHNLANVYRAMGDLDQAMVCLRQSDAIARLHLLPIQRSFHLTSMAHIQLQQGEIDAALETYRAAVDLSRRARHADGLVQSLRMLGNTLLGLGRDDEALPCLQEAAGLFAQLEDRGSEAEMWSSIARILERQSPAEAPEVWRQVLDRQRKRGDARGELDAREGLARADRAADPIGAIPAFEGALALAAMIGAQERELAIRNALGSLEWDRGSYQAALAHYEAALALVRQQGDRVNEPAVLNSLGVTLARLGRPDEARTVLEDSLALSRSLGERLPEAHALAGLGQVALGSHDLRAAITCFEHSLDVRRELGDRSGEGWMQLRLAALRETTGDLAGARAARDAATAAAVAAGDATLAAACARAATGSSRP